MARRSDLCFLALISTFAACASVDQAPAPAAVTPGEDAGQGRGGRREPPLDAGADTRDARTDASPPTTCTPATGKLAVQTTGMFEATPRAVGRRAVFDSLGNMVLVAHVRGPLTLGSTVLPEVGSADVSDLVIVKLGPSGNVIWALRPSEGGDFLVDPGAADVAVDDADDILVTGVFEGTANFGGGSLVTGSGGAGFVTKLDAQGHWKWTRVLSPSPSAGSAYARGFRIALDSARDAVVAGSFRGTVDFGGTARASEGSGDFFVAKVRGSDGSVTWSTAFGNDGGQAPYGVAVDATGNVALTGWSEGVVDFGGGPLGAPGGASTIPIVKLDAAGHHVFSKNLGADQLSHRQGGGIAFDPCDQGIVVTGWADKSVDFGNGSTEGKGSFFVARYGATGTLDWVRRYNPIGTWDPALGGAAAGGNGVTVDASGDIVVVGEVSGQVDIGGTKVGDPANRSGATGWVAKFDRTGNVLSVFPIARGHAYGIARASGTIVATGDLVGSSDLGKGPVPLTLNATAAWWLVLKAP